MNEIDESDRSARFLAMAVTLLLLGSATAGCISGDSSSQSLTQTGSSTVLPLAERWAAAFPDATISVAGGGSSHGLSSLLSGDAELGDASRKIGSGDYEEAGCSVSQGELDAARQGSHPWRYPECNGVQPTEWVVAFDVLTVVVNENNDWIDDGLNYSQLQAIFTTENTAEYWDEVPGLSQAPHERIQIFAPDQASGTYEFFFEEVAGSAEKSLLAAGNPRYSGSANDNEIIRAVKNNPNAAGFIGFSYYLQNEGEVKAVAVAEEGTQAVEPSYDTVTDYPITRPLHIYTDEIPAPNGTGKQPAIHGYLTYVLSPAGQQIVNDVGYVKATSVDSSLVEAQRAALE